MSYLSNHLINWNLTLVKIKSNRFTSQNSKKISNFKIKFQTHYFSSSKFSLSLSLSLSPKTKTFILSLKLKSKNSKYYVDALLHFLESKSPQRVNHFISRCHRTLDSWRCDSCVIVYLEWGVCVCESLFIIFILGVTTNH